ncbi:MAG: hypothetical protein KJO11_12195, partial [Gemmatimonadetes bacterium]|nr:hypothetical protein [Gemmatimonadota bacterium]
PWIAAAVAALVFSPASSSAQAPVAPPAEATRAGVHFSIGLGPGSASASCPGCGADFFEDRLTGVSGIAQLGFFANRRLAVAAEFIGWLKNDAPIYRRVAGLGVSVLGYPSATSGFFVKGSVGGLRAIAEDDLLLIQTDAWMATTGIGYDVPVGENVSLTLYANYVRGFGGSTWVNGVSSPVVVTPNAIQVGAGFTVH